MKYPKQVLEFLEKKFQLRQNDILILSIMTKEGLTAEDICKKTNIPKGRIYDFLNDLLQKKLILKNTNSPAKYFIDNARMHINAFIRAENDDFIQRQRQLNSLVEELENPVMVTIESKIDYARWLVKALEEDNEVMLICPHRAVPFALVYPEDEEEFIRVRQLINNNRSTLTGANEITRELFHAYSTIVDGKKPAKLLMWSEAVQWHLQQSRKILKSKYSTLVKQIQTKLKRPNIQARMIPNAFPYHLFVSDKRVITLLIFEDKISGLVIMDQKAVRMYRQLFESLFQNTQPFHLERIS